MKAVIVGVLSAVAMALLALKWVPSNRLLAFAVGVNQAWVSLASPEEAYRRSAAEQNGLGQDTVELQINQS